ncbi:MAG: SDR family NAD(P)-dependent oxidoreductase [Nocardioides sp.]|uniref:SDR family NAD(P)-dependent oxidoreductase n=1 Tax=Nocardioides sp. TaxID=35761 RepID=UPI003EFE13C8
MSRRVLVTGAASGLGAALARAYRDAGDDVLATDRTDGAGVDLVLDVTSDDDWAAALAAVRERWGGLDVLVNNAGIAGGGRVDVSTLAEWQRLVDVNLLSLVRGTQTFTPLWKAQGSGHVVNVASLAGLVHPAGMGGYNATKAAVVAFTETLGHELADFGIRASVVCPSYFRSNLVASLSGADEAVGQVVGRLIDASPLTAADIAEATLAALEAGDDLVLPDAAGRQAVDLKRTDRATYDAVMRHQATALHAAAQRQEENR